MAPLRPHLPDASSGANTLGPKAAGNAALTWKRGGTIRIAALTCSLALSCAPNLGFERAPTREGGRDGEARIGGGTLVDGGSTGNRDGASGPDARTPADAGTPESDGGGGAADGGALDAACPGPHLLVAVSTRESSGVPGHVARLSLAGEDTIVECAPLTGGGALVAGAGALASPTPELIVVANDQTVQGIDVRTDSVQFTHEVPTSLLVPHDGFVLEDPTGTERLAGITWTGRSGGKLMRTAVFGADGHRQTWHAHESPDVESLTQHPNDTILLLGVTDAGRMLEVDLFSSLTTVLSAVTADQKSIYALHDGTAARLTGTSDSAFRLWAADPSGRFSLISTFGGCEVCEHRLHAAPDPRAPGADFFLCAARNDGPSVVVHHQGTSCEVVYRSATVALDARATRLAVSPLWR